MKLFPIDETTWHLVEPPPLFPRPEGMPRVGPFMRRKVGDQWEYRELTDEEKFRDFQESLW